MDADPYLDLLQKLELPKEMLSEMMNAKRRVINDVDSIVQETTSFLNLNWIQLLSQQAEQFVKRFESIEGNMSEMVKEIKELIEEYLNLI